MPWATVSVIGMLMPLLAILARLGVASRLLEIAVRRVAAQDRGAMPGLYVGLGAIGLILESLFG
ncbi:MAG: hypothetical protein AAGI51_02000 [Pseudomonadota bacterium]